MILDNAQAPLYVQLADLFRQRIVKGMWREGEMLPSLEKLVAEFGVARVTVRQAIERLTRDGLVSPQRGRGTFVTGAPQADRWLKVETTLENVMVLGVLVLVRTVLIGLLSAALIVPLAFALAYVMRFVFERRGQLILQLVLLSLFSGYLVRIYAWRTILGKQGLLNSTLTWSGW